MHRRARRRHERPAELAETYLQARDCRLAAAAVYRLGCMFPRCFCDGGVLVALMAAAMVRLFTTLRAQLPLAQKYIIGRVGLAMELACLLTGTFSVAALRVHALHGCDLLQRTSAAMFGDIQLQPRNVLAARAGRASCHLGDNRAALDLPGRPGVMAPDRLSLI